MSGTLIVLDSLFDRLDVEAVAAAQLGWNLNRWDGSEAMLRVAEAVLHVTTRIDAQMQGLLGSCRVIGRFGTGLDSVDRSAAASRGIAVVGVQHYCIPELASHTLGLAFALDRRLGDYSPDWSWQEAAHQVRLPGRNTAAVIGFGAMGQAVAHALAAVGIAVRVVTQHNIDRAGGLAIRSLAEAIDGADYVFIHASLNAETAMMIGAGEIARLDKNAILINTARLGLVDETALAHALLAGNIAGVGLDAKLSSTSPLRRLLGDPRLIVTPHIGWYSERSAGELRRRAVQNTIAEVERLRANQESKP